MLASKQAYVCSHVLQDGKTALELCGSNSVVKAVLQERDVLSPEEWKRVYERVKAMLSLQGEQQAGRMIGGMADLKSGKFKDSAGGIMSYLGVDEAWDERTKCTEEGMVREVRGLCDCPECAKEQAQVLKQMARDKEAEYTFRLANELAALKSARETKQPTKPLLDKVAATRAEIEAFQGWVYGSLDELKAIRRSVAWPPESVSHARGSYGQPMCEQCKTLYLDFSSIWADLCYILFERASEKKCFNGTRDEGNAGKDLDDFMGLEQVLQAKLSRFQLAALRLYTSHSYAAINAALRLHHQPHPLPSTVMGITSGLKQLRALDAESDKATAVIELFRGFTDMQVTEDFMRSGGTELAPMSTTTDLDVACGYALRKGKTNGALLMKIVTSNNLQRGADLTFVSMFPGESETLFPPLTFMQPTGKQQVVEVKQDNGDMFKLTIVEVTTTLP